MLNLVLIMYDELGTQHHINNHISRLVFFKIFINSFFQFNRSGILSFNNKMSLKRKNMLI